jgi:predicted transcriptional regulator
MANRYKNTLQQVLDKEGLKQSDIAKESKISTVTINKICVGVRTTPTPATRTRILNAVNKLKTSNHALYSEEDIFIRQF